MNKYYILTPPQMDRLVQQQQRQKPQKNRAGEGVEAVKEQSGGAFIPDIELSGLPQLNRLEKSIKKHLKNKPKRKRGEKSAAIDPYVEFATYMDLQKRLNRLYDWIKTRGSHHESSSALPPAPSTNRAREPTPLPLIDFGPPAVTIKRNIMDEPIKRETPSSADRRQSRLVSGIPIKRDSTLRRYSIGSLREKRIKLSPKAPPTTPVVSPRRSRSKGPPSKWATIDDVRRKNPLLSRF